MLMHRVEPVYPTLPRQTGQEGTVELHASSPQTAPSALLQVLEAMRFSINQLGRRAPVALQAHVI